MGRVHIEEMPWFVSDLGYPDARRTVLAGTAFANRLVGTFETPEEAQALVASHNERLKQKGPAEAATSPSHGSNNPNQERAVNEQHGSTASAEAASRTDWFRRFGEHDSALRHARALSDVLLNLMHDSVGREDIAGPFHISERDANGVFALLRALDESLSAALEGGR